MSTHMYYISFQFEVQVIFFFRTQLSDTMINVLFPKHGQQQKVDAYRDKVVENVETQNEVSSLVMKSHEVEM